MDFARGIAKAGLNIGAIKLSPDEPFVWASGYQMPIYNANRMFLFYPEHRDLIARGFGALFDFLDIDLEVIAGTSTAGISPATTLADQLSMPVVYVRDKPKDHGLKNQIEGIDAEKDLEGRSVVLVEDLISTGGSSARAVQAIRNANGKCNLCISIFTYGLDKAAKAFRKLDPECETRSLLTYERMLGAAKDTGYISVGQVKMLEEWRADPFGWGENNGFPKLER